jgi:putative addiction module component (TIGR02574 family)
MSNLTATALELSVPERLQLVQDLWDSIVTESGGQVSAEDLIEAERRLAAHEAQPETGISWETIQSNWHSRR